MLNKILSNLHFNPDYLQLLKEYQVKQSREKFIRGLGFLFIALAFITQIIAFTPSSAQTSASASDNDLIYGGVTSKQQIIDDCNTNYHYIQLIYGTYTVSCADIASPNSTVVSLNSTDYGGNLWSVGHLPYGIAGETPVTLYGGGVVYWRYLHGWDTNGSSTYTALRVTADNGKTFYILFNCGNLVSIGFPTPGVPPNPPTPTPAPCKYNSGIYATNPACKPCPSSQNGTDVVSCLAFAKTASNVTAGITDANNTTAKPGDDIRYTLSVTNTGKATSKKFIIQDSISDILDYATVSQTGNGGTVDSQNNISWPAVNIAPGETISESFNVIVKNPLPQFAPNKDDPQSYNGVMTNFYGNVINIKVKQTAVVAVTASATTALPNTGPGTSIFIIFIITTVAGYFYSRSRLLNKEALVAETIVAEGRL
jgi:uncharacterized repeat protein (TIGR01451 family)